MATTELERPTDRPTSVGRLRAVLRRAYEVVERSRRPEPEPEPYLEGVTRCGRALWRAGLLGAVASIAIFVGATQPNSPFTEKLPGAWFFGIPAPSPVPGEITPPGQGLFFGVVAVYGGMLLMLRAWSEVARIAARHPGIPVRRFAYIFLAWVAPLVVVAPLFSRDAYAYVAQGEQMTRGINPYLYGTNVLGATTMSRLADPLWGNVSSPYGPVFLGIAGAIVHLANHHELASLVGMRLLALAGTVMFAIAVPDIARSYQRDPARAFALAALNPVVLFSLVAGAHNDALMIGLLAVALALARRRHPVIAVVCCGLAAAVKVPALLGAVYIGWEWLGDGRSVRERFRPAASALGLAVATMAVCSQVVGLGWGWIRGLSNPDTVWSWMDPPTAVGLVASRLLGAIGLGHHTHVLLTLARGSAALGAVAIACYLLVNSARIGTLRALGFTFLAVVVLSPVVQPWYLCWGFVFLAPVAEGRTRRMLVLTSGIACFVGLPSGHVLLDELTVANPLLTAIFSALLVGIGGSLVWPRLRRIAAELRLARLGVTRELAELRAG